MHFAESDGSISEDEDFQLDDDEHSHFQNSSAMSSNSMYSRIYQDVRQQIPNVDFASVESEDELILNGGRQSSIDTEDCKGESTSNGPSSLQAFKEPINECSVPENDLIDTEEEAHTTSNSTGSAQTLRNDASDTVNVEQQSIGISTNTKHSTSHFAVSSKTGTLSLALTVDIKGETLDKALEKIRESSFDGEKKDNAHKQSILHETCEKEDDTETLLISKLSSFSLSEKESSLEMNELLSKVSSDSLHKETKEIQTEEDHLDEDDVFKSMDKGDGLHAKSFSEQTEGEKIENQTVYLDLRKDIQDVIVKNSKDNMSLVNAEHNSTSSSEDEDWNEMRKSIKSGIDIKLERSKQEINDAPRATISNIDEKMKTSISNIDKSSAKLRRSDKMNDKISSNKQYCSKERMLNYGSKRDECFDLEPLADKIRSWHQVGKCTNEHVINEQNMKAKHNNDLMCDEQFDSDVVNNNYNIVTDIESADDDGYVDSEHAQRDKMKDQEVLCENMAVSQGLLECHENGSSNMNDFKNIEKFKEDQNEEAMKNNILEDSSLLKLESFTNSIKDNVNFNSSLFLTKHTPTDSNGISEAIEIDDSAEHVRITENLMLIKADISAGEKLNNVADNNIKVIPDHSQESKEVIGNVKAGSCIVVDVTKSETCEQDVLKDKVSLLKGEVSCENGRDSTSKRIVEQSLSDVQGARKRGNDRTEWNKLTYIIDEETEGKRAQETANNTESKDGILHPNEIELKTFPLKTKERDDIITLNSENIPKLKEMPSNIANGMLTGEETPLIQNEKVSRTFNENNYSKFTNRRTKTSFSEEHRNDIDHNDNLTSKDDNISKKKNLLEGNGSMENLTSGKNKKKSKRRSNRFIEETKSNGKNEKKKDDDIDMSILNKHTITTENEDVKKKAKSLKENERIKIRQQIQSLQSEYGISNIIYDEEHSYSEAFGCITKSAEKSSKLLLQINLECSGVCDKTCAKNTLTFKERSDAYIGLCTFFLSILNGNKFNICDTLQIPFTVVAFQQACIDSELRIFIGVIENEISGPSSQPQKRGKHRVRKNFYQTVTQYLNKTDLENVLSDLMMFETKDNYASPKKVTCPGGKKLSSYVSVSQDYAAVDRIFGLKPALIWNKTKEIEDMLSYQVAWIPVKEKMNENTVVLIDNVTSLLPSVICEFMKMTREISLDISGLRIAYLINAAGKEMPYLVAALRGPNITTANIGKKFTSESRGLSSVKSSFMRSEFFSSPNKPKTVSIIGPPDCISFPITIADPLLTYIIGRRRGESEVIRWFGRRLSQVSDIEIESKMPDKSRDILTKNTPTSSLLSVTYDNVLLSISSLVPSVFISIALTVAESRGLYPVCIGKSLLCEDEILTIGLRIVTQKDDVMEEKNRKKDDKKLKYSVMMVLFQGENACFRAIGLLNELYIELNRRLPQNALMKETLHHKLNGMIRYERVQQQRHVDDFFAVCPMNKKISKILDHMTSPHFSHNDNEIMNKMSPSLNHIPIHEEPRLCAAIFAGNAMIEMMSYILNTLFSNCIDDPLCKEAPTTSTMSTTDNAFIYQERPAAEIIGLKHFLTLPKHMAHICNRFVIGSNVWLNNVQNLESVPIVVMVIKWMRMSDSIDAYCEQIWKYVTKRLKSNDLISQSDSYYDSYAFSDIDTVLRIMLTMFDANELLQDNCTSWFKDTQWPTYIDNNNQLIKELNPYLSILNHHQNQHHGFKEIKQINRHSNHSIQIIPPLTLNVPTDLILTSRQRSLSFIKIQVDWNFPKYIPKILNVLRRDGFKIVGLNFPGGLSPSFDTCPQMHVAVSRVNAVYRLNQWLPELKQGLHNKHILEVSGTARRAYEEISWHFQRSETGGIFDESPLTTAEKLKFKEDDVFACRNFRRIEWDQNTTNKKSASREDVGKGHCKKGQLESDNCFIMPEVNIIIMTNVLLRCTYLGQRLSENVQYLGLWEKLSSLGFKTIGARMTSLKETEAEVLLEKFHLNEQQHHALINRLSMSNGPIIVLVVLRDFAVSNFWNIISKSMTDEELRLFRANTLVPSNRDQVEVLLGSLFETVVPNSEVEIKKQKSKKL